MTGKVVLVTGAGGFIGSHCVLELLEAGFDVVAVDNFSNSIPSPKGDKPESLVRVEELTGKTVHFQNVDVRERAALDAIFRQFQVELVLHFAALKAVGESLQMPLEYYDNNLIGVLQLLNAMKNAGVKNFIFSSSATVYGEPQRLPLVESHPTGRGLTNPYGKTKYMIEEILLDLTNSDAEWKVVILRYFNPVGAHASGRIGEDPKGVPSNLMPYVAQVAVGKLPYVRVFGDDYPTADGTGVRDYIHVVDLAKGHLAATKLFQTGNVGSRIYNLGTGKGYSVLEMIKALENASGKTIPYKMEPRRAGDLASVYCDPELATNDLGWKADFALEEMCRDLWNWQISNPDGFRK